MPSGSEYSYPSSSYFHWYLCSPFSEFRDAETNRKYRVQVAFKLCVQPNSYHVRPQSNSEPLDLHLSNSELAWQTMCGGPVYLCGLLVRLCAK